MTDGCDSGGLVVYLYVQEMVYLIWSKDHTALIWFVRGVYRSKATAQKCDCPANEEKEYVLVPRNAKLS
jgi:hypothetical protein